jgi:hypothetical protein
MTRRRLIVWFIGLVSLVLLGTTHGPLDGRELAFDCELHGTVSIHGQPAPVGTRIEAYVDGSLLADTTVRSRGLYEIVIPPDDPVTLEKDGWADNDVLTFAVGGETAQPTVVAFEGPLQVDLSVRLVSEVRRTTWGKIKALFR